MSKSKISTANIKSPNYTENHQIFVGTHTGSFKKIDVSAENPHKQINLQSIATLNKDSRITSLSWGNDERTQILIGRANKFIKVYDVANNEFTSNLEIDNGSIVGLCRYNEQLIAACDNGTVHILKDHSSTHEMGDHLSVMRQCKSEPKFIATGGKGLLNCLKIYDLETMQQVFKSKNLPNDYLQLQVPVWDTDISFIDSNYCLATCSRYGYIRVYDTRKQRRPIISCGAAVNGGIKNSKEIQKMTYTCMATNGYNLYVGAATGILFAYDYRKPKSPLHTYKGFTGSITDVGIDETGHFLYTSCLDRFVRVYDANTTHLQYQCYVKSKATKILLKTISPSNNNGDEDCLFIENKKEEPIVNGDDNDDELDALFDQMPIVGENKSGEKRKNSLPTKRDKKKRK